MADPFDPDYEDQQEQSVYDQEEAQRAQLLDSREPPQTFTGYGEPVALSPTEAISTAPQPQPAQQQPQYARVGETFTADSFQPQQTQRGVPLAPYPQVAPTGNRKAQTDADYQRRFGPIISDEFYDVRPELAPQPTGGLGTVVGLDLSTAGHQISSLLGISLKQLGASTEYIDHVNEQWQKFNEGLTASLDPSRQAAAGVSIFDPKHLFEVAGKNPGAVLESYLVTGAVSIAGGLGVGTATKLAARTAARLAGVALETEATAGAAATATAAGRAVEGAGVAGAGALGGAQGAGARYEDYAHTIDNMTPEEKANSAMYQQFRRQNMDDAAAKDAMKQQFPTLQQFGANFIASTGLAAVTPGLRLGQARPTRLGNVAVGAAEAGGAGAAGTGYSSYRQQESNVAAGAQPSVNWGRVGAEAAVGGGFGAALGGGFGAIRGRAPEQALPPPGTPPPPAMLALPPPGDVPGPGGVGNFTMRRDTVQPAGVAPENTAALNAAGIGSGRQQFRPRGPSEVVIGPDETGPNIPPRYDEPAGAIYPPPRAPLGSEGAIPTGSAIPPPGVPLLGVSRERGPGFTAPPEGAPVRAYEQPVGPPAGSQIPPSGPLRLTASPERGAGFVAPPEGAPVRAYAEPAGPPVPPPPLPPETGPRRLTASPERGAGFVAPPEGAPVRAYAEPVGPPVASVVPPPGPARLTASRERGPGFVAPAEGAPVRAYEEPAGPPAGSAIPPEGAPRLTATRERGEGFTVREPDAAAPQLTASRERGEGFTTEPPPAAPRPSEGLNARQLDQRLAEAGLTKPQIARLVGRDKKAAMLDKLAQESAARGEEPAPATPRGAETREPPAPTGRPSEGMSHKALGEALEKLGLSKREVNQLTNKVQRAAEYDRIVQSEAASLERIRRQEGASDETPTPPREEKASAPQPPATPRAQETTAPEIVTQKPAPKAAAVKEQVAAAKAAKAEARAAQRRRRALADQQAEEAATRAQDELPPPAVEHELPLTQASRDQRNQPTAATSPMSRVMADDRVNAPVREAIDAGGGLHAGLRALANSPYINKRLPHVAAYARSLLRLAPDLELRPGAGDRRGALVSEQGARHIEVGERSAEVLLHEGTHTVADRFIDSLHPGSREMQVLQTIRAELERAAVERGVRDHPAVDYALGDPHELHAMLRTSPELNDLMRGVNPGPEYRAKMAQLGYSVGAAKSLWQSFVRFIRQALHLPQNVTSLMDHVMRPLDDITASAARFNREGSVAPTEGYRGGWERQSLGDRSAVERLAPNAHPDEVGRAVESDYRSALELPYFDRARAAVDTVWDERQARGRGAWDTVRPGFLQAATGDSIVSRYAPLFTRAGRNLLHEEREARRRTERRALDVFEQHEDNVKSMMERLRRDPAPGRLGFEATLAEARLGSADPAANAHLTTDAQITELKRLQGEYNKLTPEGQKLYHDLNTHYNKLYYEERQAKLDGIVASLLPEATEAQRTALKEQLRTERGTQQLIDNPRTLASVAEALAMPTTVVRAIAQFHRMGFVRGDYFPLRRYGEYVLVNGDRQSENYQVEMFEHRKDAEARRVELVSERDAKGNLVNPDVQQITTKATSHMRDMTLGNPILDELTRHVASRYGTEQSNAIHDMLASIMLQHMTRSEATRTRMRRQGISGASDDPVRVLAGDTHAAAYRIGYYAHGLERAAALRDMRIHVDETRRGVTDEQRGLQAQIEQAAAAGQDTTALSRRFTELQHEARPSLTDATTAQQVLNEIEKRQPQSDDPASQFWGRAMGRVTQASFVHSLMSVSQAMVNTMEGHILGTALIGGRHGMLRVGVQLSRAVAEMLPTGIGRMGSLTAKTLNLWGQELRQKDWNFSVALRDRLVEKGANAGQMKHLFDALRASNLLDAGGSLQRDLQRIVRPPTSGNATRLYDRFMDLNSILGHVSEETNKAAIAKVAFDLELRRLGNAPGALEKATAYALEQVSRAIPNYRNKARLATAQGSLKQFGPALMQFRNYGLHMYSLLSVLGREMMHGENRLEAAKSVVGLIAMHSMAAGVINWVADPLRYVMGAYDLVTGAKHPHNYQNNIRSWASDIFGPTLGEMVSRGLPRAGGYGVDLGRRIGMANPLNMPDINSYDSKGILTVIGSLMTGASGQTVADVGNSVTSMFQGKPLEAVTKLVPRNIRDVIQAGQLTEGVKDPRGSIILPPERFGIGAIAAKGLGFNPAAIAEFREQRRDIQETRTETDDARKAVMDMFAMARTASDRNAAGRALVQYNQANPSYRIKFDQIESQRRELAKQIRDPRTAGLQIAATRRDLLQVGQAYNMPR